MSFPGFQCSTMEFTQLYPLSTSPLAASMTTSNASLGLTHFQNMQKDCTFTMLLFIVRINQVRAAHYNTKEFCLLTVKISRKALCKAMY